MNQPVIGQTEQWLQVSAQILMEEPARLQQCILTIYKNRPELCCYATELAKTIDCIERIIGKTGNNLPAGRALSFFADLVKANLDPLRIVY